MAITGSGRLGQSSTKDSVQVRFDAARLIHLIDKQTQNFRSGAFYAALKRANEQMARIAQEGMVARLNSQINQGRPQRDGKRLEISIENPKNTEVFANTFSVGLENWMNQSPAKMYWRQIDEGMAGYEAKVMFTDNGPFGTTGPPWVRPGKKGTNMRMTQFKPGSRLGVIVQVSAIKPFHYSSGGQEAVKRAGPGSIYVTHLTAAGFDVKEGIFK